ncbi:MAG: hypothetical protein JRF33_22845 [Deltaproteobacteria bacterium]|nr:hypothetical protein [Deltaproteobacteria bacterium]
MNARFLLLMAMVVSLVLGLVACSEGGPGPSDGGLVDAGRIWQPPVVHEDTPYLQELSLQWPELGSCTALALDPEDARIYAACEEGVQLFEGDGFSTVDMGLSGVVLDLAFDEAGRFAAVDGVQLAIDGVVIDLPADSHPVFVGPRLSGGFFVAGDDVAGYVDAAGGFTSLFEVIQRPSRCIVESAPGLWFAATPDGVFDSDSYIHTVVDGLPSDDLRALVRTSAGELWAATGSGLARFDEGSETWIPFLGEEGLHYGDFLNLGVDGEDTLLASTAIGASRYHADGDRRYYWGRIWLPHDEVRDMLRDENGDLWFATAMGLSRAQEQLMCLADKAELFDAITAERHVRMGYTSTSNALRVVGDLESFYNHDDDNDGQWTAMYLASQSYRYAVTGSEAARETVERAATAMIRLESVTGIPGFFARSIVPGEECPARQATHPDLWHLTPDGLECWKGNTSNDEFVGHMFGLSLYYDLAADAERRAEVAATVGRILDRLIENGFAIIDTDGLTTDDGHMDPEWINDPDNLSARYGDAGLNSSMILGGLRVAYHMTGEARYLEAFENLAYDHGYKEHVSHIEEINTAWHTNHDAEEMSFLSMFTLMRFETEMELWLLWRQGLEYLWHVQRPERNPEFNVMYAIMSEAPRYDLAEGVATLQNLPLDLILWGGSLAHRLDAEPNPNLDRHGERQNLFVFPYAERQGMRWAENPYAFKFDGTGAQENSGTFWLLPYWMARHHGLISPPSP